MNYYINFIERFPNIAVLSEASTDDVLLYWKGLGYYSRAINLHKASKQIINDFNGKFPEKYEDILKLKGIGQYTAAAISSICFDEKRPAVDGNFYRVLSRIFADNYDISQNNAFNYFSGLALKLMSEHKAGDFNQAIMDLGSEICKPKNPNCVNCPLVKDCIAFSLDKISEFPVKSKKVKTTDLSLNYFFVHYRNQFLIKQRNEDFIWKKLYEFPTEIPENFMKYIINSKIIHHKLTHKNLIIRIDKVELRSKKDFEKWAKEKDFIISDSEKSEQKSFPKPLENYISIHL